MVETGCSAEFTAAAVHEDLWGSIPITTALEAVVSFTMLLFNPLLLQSLLSVLEARRANQLWAVQTSLEPLSPTVSAGSQAV
jgi:hypothetical protein